MRIAVDAMGGDFAPRNVIEGTLDAASRLRIGVTLVGPSEPIERELASFPQARQVDVRIVEAHDVIAMGESSSALRRKPRASVAVAVDLVARGEAAAMVTAGNTGAAVLAAHMVLGMLPDIDRPALATTIPTLRGRAVLLDSGANLECRPPQLLQFAAMGVVYARAALGIAAPRVGLLSIGEEETKGTELMRDAHQLLKAQRPDFIGNVEARDLFSGRADVIVCDGMTGNIALKVGEGLVEAVEHLLYRELGREWASRLGLRLALRAFRRFRARVDYSEYGGAPLMGVNGLCIVGHGRSSAKAIGNAVAMAHRLASADLVDELARGLYPTPVLPAQ
jgi:glycerol-3-phosphate acyltransferase PlsX